MEHSDFLEIIYNYSLQLSKEEDNDDDQEANLKGFLFITVNKDANTQLIGAKITLAHAVAVIQSLVKIMRDLPEPAQDILLKILLEEAKELSRKPA